MKEQIVDLLIKSVDFNKVVAAVKDGKISKEELKDAIQFDGLADGLLDDVISPVLDKVVADSSNKWDDTAKAMLWPLFSEQLKKLVHDKLEA